ncbi:hypothetical protein [Spirosoma montaniterrae]|uniref:Uncharacterized protein n=1 Tax=Spirosoma montaniterrae TaxID=1178516 RepID=A0A1P9WUK8_9BACT|nr:hypothetical protein [Spirosoma montaniterrae]AQG79076.1 hypothetical protein AWR27_06910 [Spirosoma montaniterrae]
MSFLLSIYLFFSTLSAQQQPAWTYKRTVEAGAVVYRATVLSPTRLDFGYPYGGGAIPRLTLRSRSDGTTHVYVEVSKGQFNRSFQNGTARIRFDQQPERKYSVSAAANGRANIVFLDTDRAFIDQLKRAKKLTVRLAFVEQKGWQMDFPVAGLVWAR